MPGTSAAGRDCSPRSSDEGLCAAGGNGGSTLANGGVQISAQHDVTYPDGIQADLDKIKADIISGKIKVTSAYNK